MKKLINSIKRSLPEFFSSEKKKNFTQYQELKNYETKSIF